MQSLADFLNHGILPFMGRDAEMRRILDFWRGTFEATELRAMLVTGEAGIGKSRLLEQVVRQIVDAGGSVVHVKLYAESTASFVSLVARSLWHGPTERSILGEEPEAKLGPVGSALQRLARLRPTLLVLEDLHLLGAEALPELSRLLNLLADETMSVLALARPVELEARGSLEPYITAEFTLPGLAREECASVWEEVSGSATGVEVAAALHDATAGNPLALRSALRGVLNSGNGKEKRWASAESVVALTQTLKRTVGLLADGMTVHLSPEELSGARLLATLGEVFSREAAGVMLGETDGIIESLLFNGVIATAVAPPDPLPGGGSNGLPLGFTHTLLHRQLIENRIFDADRLVRVVADCPLYSLVPFRLLSTYTWVVPMLESTTIMRAYDRAIKVEIAVNRSTFWRTAEQAWSTAVQLLRARLGTWEQDDWERMLVKLINHKLNLIRREPVEIRKRWLDYLDSTTATAATDELVKGRLNLLTSRDLLYSSEHPEVTAELWGDAEILINDRPHLQTTFAYTDYVIAACISAYANGDTRMSRVIEQRVDKLMASSELPATVRGTFERKARAPLLALYDSEEELHSRLAQVMEFERTVEKNDLSVWNFCIELLAAVASVDMLVNACNSVIPIMREHGMTGPLANTVAKQQRVLAGRSESFSSAIESFDAALAEVPEWRRNQIQGTLALFILDGALLRGEPDRARDVIARYGISTSACSAAQRILLALHSPEPFAALIAAREAGSDEGEFAPLVDQIIEGTRADGPAEAEILLGAPVLRLNDILRTVAVVGWTALVDQQPTTDVNLPERNTGIADALVRSLEWLAAPDRRLFAFMRPILDLGRRYMTPKQIASWTKKIDELADNDDHKAPSVASMRLKLSMLGTISAETRDGQSLRFQGARARNLLAMMVVNQMLKEPLGSVDFCRLAAGDDSIENARDVVKTTVHRIREQIGRDAILTDGQSPPRLDPRLVTVDLLEAHALLKRAAEASRTSSPMQAKVALMAALEITGSEVPFPSIYDDFVEAVRADFESEMRATIMNVVRGLTREGGMADAAEVLQRGCDALPGDEEMSDLLQETLLQMGRNAEASQVRMKSEAEY